MIYGLLFSALTGGFIGWITNWIAVKALFHPRDPIKYRFFEYQGLMPKRHKELAKSVGKLVEGELINAETLFERVKPEDLDPIIAKIAAKVRGDIETRIKSGLAEFVAKVPFFNLKADSFIASLMNKAEAEIAALIKKQLPSVLEVAAKDVSEKLSVQEIVSEKISEMDIMKLESLFERIAGREMAAIVNIGGILGVVVGVTQFFIQKYLII